MASPTGVAPGILGIRDAGWGKGFYCLYVLGLTGLGWWSVECSCVLLSVYLLCVVLPPPLPTITCLLVGCALRCVLGVGLNKGCSRSRAVYGARELLHRLTWAPVSPFPHCSPQ